jgi:hypothetical protein
MYVKLCVFYGIFRKNSLCNVSFCEADLLTPGSDVYIPIVGEDTKTRSSTHAPLELSTARTADFENEIELP